MSVFAYPEYKDSGVAWLGCIPSDWTVERFRHVFRESPEKIESEVVGPMLSVSGYRGIEIKDYDDENRRRLDEDLIGYRIVRPGQLVVNTMWLNYAGLGVSGHEGHVSPAYRSYWIERDVDRRYIHHLMRSAIYVQGYTRLLTGIRPNSLQMSRDDLMDFPVILPPRADQAAIAYFLDRETAKIDALVAEQERLIALLKEKRQAVISHAVTKGLNPDAPMKDSGIEWLGEIPAHWTPIKLGRASFMQEGPGLRTWQFTSEGTRVICVTNITDAGIDFSRLEKYISTDEYRESYEHFTVENGDVLLSSSGNSWGKVAIYGADEKVILNTSTIRLHQLEQVRLTSEFIAFLLQSDAVRDQLELAMTGACQPNFGPTHLNSVMIAAPPRGDQDPIVEFLHAKCQRFGVLIADAQSAIALLRERRAALISAAVTGKIDVRGLAAPSNVIPIDRARAHRDLPPIRAVVGGHVVLKLGDMGRMAVMKGGFLAEAHIGMNDIGGRYDRAAAGPYDSSVIAAMERGANELCGISTIEPPQAGAQVRYQIPNGTTAPRDDLIAHVGQDRADAFAKLLTDLSGIGRDGVEAVATLYAVWNDLLAAGKAADDASIFAGFLNDWHAEKRERFDQASLEHWIGWMRRHNIIPTGKAPRTDHQESLPL